MSVYEGQDTQLEYLAISISLYVLYFEAEQTEPTIFSTQNMMHAPTRISLLALTLLTLGNAFPAGDASAAADTPNNGGTAPAVLTPKRLLAVGDNPKLFAPRRSTTLYFDQPSAPGSAVQASSATLAIPELNYPAINLLSTAAIKSVVCNSGTATVTFATKEAYDVALKTWPSLGPFILISFSDSCGTGTGDGMHDFILVNKITSQNPEAATLAINIQTISFEQAVNPNATLTVSIGGPSVHVANRLTTTDDPADLCLAGTFDNALDHQTASVRRSPDTLIHQDFGDLAGSLEDAAPKVRAVAINMALDSAAQAAESAATAALTTINGLFDISKTLTKDVSFKQYPTNAQSPFGSAYRLYNGPQLQAYCVGCGADGKFRLTGQVKFSLTGGFKAGRLSANGQMNAGMALGLVGTAAANVPFPEVTFVQIPLGGFSIPGIITIGPSARIGAGGSANLKAAGQLLAGAKLTWPNINAAVDFVNPGSSGVSGFSPTVVPQFSANGAVSLVVDAHLTAALGFGVSLLNNKWSKSIELIDQPGVQATATFSKAIRAISNDTKPQGEVMAQALTSTCKGVSLSAKIYNNVKADILGIKQFNLFSWSSTPYTKCLSKRGLTIDSNPQLERRQPEQLTGSIVARDGPTVNPSVTLSSVNGLYKLRSFADGNVYADQASSKADDGFQFTGTKDGTIILADGAGRTLHAYSTELSQYGVSRLRLHASDDMPATALPIGLTAVSDQKGSSALIAFDTSGQALYPVMCATAKCYPKIFLAKDAQQGARRLEDLAAITGQTGLKCSFLQLKQEAFTVA